MDLDELFARKPDDLLTQVTRQDLDPLSIAELEERIQILESELGRVRAKMSSASRFKEAASSLFKT
jgi:uncharacterized small protein (DUF1192 family)